MQRSAYRCFELCCGGLAQLLEGRIGVACRQASQQYIAQDVADHQRRDRAKDARDGAQQYRALTVDAKLQQQG